MSHIFYDWRINEKVEEHEHQIGKHLFSQTKLSESISTECLNEIERNER